MQQISFPVDNPPPLMQNFSVLTCQAQDKKAKQQQTFDFQFIWNFYYSYFHFLIIFREKKKTFSFNFQHLAFSYFIFRSWIFEFTWIIKPNNAKFCILHSCIVTDIFANAHIHIHLNNTCTLVFLNCTMVKRFVY